MRHEALRHVVLTPLVIRPREAMVRMRGHPSIVLACKLRPVYWQRNTKSKVFAIFNRLHVDVEAQRR
jgi:hypothetical protein